MATYRPNHRQIARLLLSDMLQDAVKAEAERMVEHLRATGPRGSDTDDSDDSDHYVDHFRVETGIDIRDQDRRAAFVVNDSPYASVLELGSGHVKNPPQPMTRLMESAKD